MSGGSSRRGFLRELAGVAREVRSVGSAGRDAFGAAEREMLGGAGPAAAPSDDERRVAQRSASALAPEEQARYAGPLATPEWGESAQLALRESSVLVIGLAGCGAAAALALAAAGAGRLGVLDPGDVAVSDLASGSLHFTPDVGVGRAQSAAAKLSFLNPEIEVVPYPVGLSQERAGGLLAGHDVVVDGSLDRQTRHVVNAACVAAGVALVSGTAAGLRGEVLAIRPGAIMAATAEFTITGANRITNTSGTNTTGSVVVVIWNDLTT